MIAARSGDAGYRSDGGVPRTAGHPGRSRAMSYGIEDFEESGSAGVDYFYFENGYYHRVRVADAREPAEVPVLVAA
jgi:hypothetical protein